MVNVAPIYDDDWGMVQMALALATFIHGKIVHGIQLDVLKPWILGAFASVNFRETPAWCEGHKVDLCGGNHWRTTPNPPSGFTL